VFAANLRDALASGFAAPDPASIAIRVAPLGALVDACPLELHVVTF
jgi:hypothetical protein